MAAADTGTLLVWLIVASTTPCVQRQAQTTRTGTSGGGGRRCRRGTTRTAAPRERHSRPERYRGHTQRGAHRSAHGGVGAGVVTSPTRLPRRRGCRGTNGGGAAAAPVGCIAQRGGWKARGQIWHAPTFGSSKQPRRVLSGNSDLAVRPLRLDQGGSCAKRKTARTRRQPTAPTRAVRRLGVSQTSLFYSLLYLQCAMRVGGGSDGQQHETHPQRWVRPTAVGPLRFADVNDGCLHVSPPHNQSNGLGRLCMCARRQGGHCPSNAGAPPHPRATDSVQKCAAAAPPVWTLAHRRAPMAPSPPIGGGARSWGVEPPPR